MSEFPKFDLADYHEPPVVETVLSLQFEKLAGMRAVHLGLFWRRIKDRYPNTEEHPPLSSVIERFPEPLPRSGRLQFEAVETTVLPRLWLISKRGTEIVQVQNDRFVTNWRKIGTAEAYPRYEPVIRPAFERDFREFQAFVVEENLGPIKVNQCEVTYVNHIISGSGWERLGEIDKIFTFWNKTPEPVPGQPEDFGLHVRFPITDERNQPIGRLHVDVQPARRASDNRPMYVMNLTARGHYGTGFDFFDIGRKWIVKSFDELTTEHMHNVWRKK